MSLFKKTKTANESLGLTYDIEATYKIGNVEYLEITFKGQSGTFDPTKDYALEYLGKPLYNGSIFLFMDVMGGYVWNQFTQTWTSMTASTIKAILNKEAK